MRRERIPLRPPPPSADCPGSAVVGPAKTVEYRAEGRYRGCSVEVEAGKLAHRGVLTTQVCLTDTTGIADAVVATRKSEEQPDDTRLHEVDLDGRFGERYRAWAADPHHILEWLTPVVRERILELGAVEGGRALRQIQGATERFSEPRTHVGQEPA